MPSFTSIATLALALFSAVPALASGLGAVEADLVQRDSLNSGSLFEKRWNNHGKSCSPHKKNWCKTDVHHGHAWCGKHNKCEWGCAKGYRKHDGKCVTVKDPKCLHHHHCKTSVKHATAFCHVGKCTYHCDAGFHVTKDGQCAAEQKWSGKCGKKTCPKVQGGWSKCVDGECKQYCEAHSGWKLYTNKHRNAYKCINVLNDKNNCGKPGHVCAYGYHHKGEPICVKGKCSLNCHGYKVAKTHSGVLYCSHKKA